MIICILCSLPMVIAFKLSIRITPVRGYIVEGVNLMSIGIMLLKKNY